MKKIILKCIAFFVILILLLLVISYIFTPKNNTKECGVEEEQAMGILGERENSIDVVVYGDSEPMSSFIPMNIWEKYGITSYVCATSGQTLPDTCKMAYDTLKKQKPKLIMLETNNLYIPTSITVPMARIINILMPITEYHNRWKSLKPEDLFGPINYNNTDINRGYYYVGRVAPADSTNYMNYSEKKEAIPTLNKLYVKFLKKYAENLGAKFMLYSTPNINNWNYARHNAMKEFADEEGIEFLDLNYLKDEININWQTETGDNGEHVNYMGAIKVTDYLANYLSQKNYLINHKNEEEYKNWNEDLAKFKEKMNELNK